MLDPVAEHLIAQIIGCADELETRLRAAETTAVTVSAAWSAAGTLEAVAESPDHHEAMMARVAQVAGAAAALRAARHRRRQGLRRQLALYRQELGLDPPQSQARPPTVTTGSGRRRVAVQYVGPDDIRRIEAEHDPPAET